MGNDGDMNHFYDKFLHDLPDSCKSPDSSYEEQCVRAIIEAYKKEDTTTQTMWQLVKTKGFKFDVLRHDYKLPFAMLVADHGKKFTPVSVLELFKKPTGAKILPLIRRTRQHVETLDLPFAIFLRSSDMGNVVIHSYRAFKREYQTCAYIVTADGLFIDSRVDFCSLLAKTIP